MAYTLTLTAGERQVFDWIGNRYAAGLIADWLKGSEFIGEWDGPDDITFTMPEYFAWEIRDLAEKEVYTWPCFSGPLANKMNTFIASIV